MSQNVEPLLPDPPTELSNFESVVFEKVIYEAEKDILCFEVFDIMNTRFLILSFKDKLSILNVNEDFKEVHTAECTSSGSNHMCFHPPTRILFYEQKTNLRSVEIYDDYSERICNNKSGICNTSYGSGTTTQVIQCLTNEDIIFPSKCERRMVVYDCVKNEERRLFGFHPGSSRCVVVRDNYIIVGGSTRFVVFDRTTFAKINEGIGSQYGFVYALNVVSGKYLVAGSYNGETFVYMNYDKPGKILLLNKWKFSNGFTNVLEHRNFAIISFKASLTLHVLSFNFENYDKIDPDNPEITTTTTSSSSSSLSPKLNYWNVSKLEIPSDVNESSSSSSTTTSSWNKMVKWVKRFPELDIQNKRVMMSISKNCKGISVWKNLAFTRGCPDFELDSDMVERIEFIRDFEGLYLLQLQTPGMDQIVFRISESGGGESSPFLVSWKSLLL